MSKYIIDIPNGVEWGVVTCRTEDGFYTRDFDSLEELNSDYINDHFGGLQDDAYHRGLSDGNDIGYKDGVKDGQNEAWEAVKALFQTFGTESACVIMKNDNVQGAIDRLKAYEEKQKAEDKIEVGDEVRLCRHTVPYIVTSCDGDDDTYILMTVNGGFIKVGKDNDVHKTGRHFDIASILEDMRND